MSQVVHPPIEPGSRIKALGSQTALEALEQKSAEREGLFSSLDMLPQFLQKLDLETKIIKWKASLPVSFPCRWALWPQGWKFQFPTLSWLECESKTSRCIRTSTVSNCLFVWPWPWRWAQGWEVKSNPWSVSPAATHRASVTWGRGSGAWCRNGLQKVRLEIWRC